MDGTRGACFYVGGFPFGAIGGGAEDVYIRYPDTAVGPLPLLSFAHGCCKSTVNDTQNDYDALFRDLAKAGFVVVAYQTCMAHCDFRNASAHQLYVISALERNKYLHPILSQVDFTRVGLLGHSVGGAATITSASVGMKNVKAAAAIHPAWWAEGINTKVAQTSVPIFFMCGTADVTEPCYMVKDEYMHTAPHLRGLSVFASLYGAEHVEIQSKTPRWNFYITNFMVCHIMDNHTACASIYGRGPDAGPDALCTNKDMVDCSTEIKVPLSTENVSLNTEKVSTDPSMGRYKTGDAYLHVGGFPYGQNGGVESCWLVFPILLEDDQDSCTDSNLNCKGWAEMGLCDIPNYRGLMKERCACSCLQAHRPPPTAAPTPAPIPTPAECTTYIRKSGCGWTSDWNCPDQPPGNKGVCAPDNSTGFLCCCRYNLWRQEGYTLGQTDSNRCPNTDLKLSSKDACQAAGRALGMKIGTRNGGQIHSDSEPGGCFQNKHGQVYYNTASGTGKKNCRAICKKGPVTTTVAPTPAPPVNGDLPFISFAHGCCKTSAWDNEADYNAVFRHLASHGIVVAVFNTCFDRCYYDHFSDDQLHLVRTLERRRYLHPVLSKVDFSRVGLMGHSMGGAATIKSASNGAENVRAAAAIHPMWWSPHIATAARNQQVPIFFMCGQNDTTEPCQKVKDIYESTQPSLSGRNIFAELRDADHLEIQKPLPGGRWDFYIVNFMLCHLSQDEVACAITYGEGAGSLCKSELMVQCSAGQQVSLGAATLDQKPLDKPLEVIPTDDRFPWHHLFVVIMSLVAILTALLKIRKSRRVIPAELSEALL